MKPSVRFKIFNRDDFKCYYCGGMAPNVELEVDHLLPKDKGGGESEENLITACKPCNRGKKNIIVTRVKKRNLSALRKMYKKPTTSLIRVGESTYFKLKEEAFKRKMSLIDLLDEKLLN